MLLARTDPDRSAAHRGLSLFIVPKPRGDGHGFQFTQEDGAAGKVGKLEARPIDTIGYRGMHSYEVALEDWWVPADHLIGEADGLGRGFYYQMEGFENGRLQTAARAIGVMQAAYEAALEYARNRKVFGSDIIDYELTRAKLGRMAVLIQAGRQFMYHVATLMAKGQGSHRGEHGQGLRVQGRRVGDPGSDADPRRHGLRRGVRRQPPVRRRPRAVDLRGRRRDALPEGDRPPPQLSDGEIACSSARPWLQ